jgi:hypothetical protein
MNNYPSKKGCKVQGRELCGDTNMQLDINSILAIHSRNNLICKEKCNCTVNEQVHITQQIMIIIGMYIIYNFTTVNHQ